MKATTITFNTDTPLEVRCDKCGKMVLVIGENKFTGDDFCKGHEGKVTRLYPSKSKRSPLKVSI